MRSQSYEDQVKKQEVQQRTREIIRVEEKATQEADKEEFAKTEALE